jgi:hypothetical protein
MPGTFESDMHGTFKVLQSGEPDADADLAGSGKVNPEALPSWMNDASEILCLAANIWRRWQS